jgi:hypothetical protein
MELVYDNDINIDRYIRFIVKAPYITLLKYYELYSVSVIEQVYYHS